MRLIIALLCLLVFAPVATAQPSLYNLTVFGYPSIVDFNGKLRLAVFCQLDHRWIQPTVSFGKPYPGFTEVRLKVIALGALDLRPEVKGCYPALWVYEMELVGVQFPAIGPAGYGWGSSKWGEKVLKFTQDFTGQSTRKHYFVYYPGQSLSTCSSFVWNWTAPKMILMLFDIILV